MNSSKSFANFQGQRCRIKRFHYNSFEFLALRLKMDEVRSRSKFRCTKLYDACSGYECHTWNLSSEANLIYEMFSLKTAWWIKMNIMSSIRNLNLITTLEIELLSYWQVEVIYYFDTQDCRVYCFWLKRPDESKFEVLIWSKPFISAC